MRDELSAKGALKSTLAGLVGQGFGRGLRTVVTLLLIQVMKRHEFGVLVSLQSFMDPLRSFSSLALEPVALRRIPLKAQSEAQIVGSVFYVRVVISCVLLLTLGSLSLTVWQDRPLGGWPLIICLMGLVFSVTSTPAQLSFQARQQMTRLIWVPFWVSVAQITFVLVAWFYGATLWVCVAALALAELVNALLLWSAYKRHVGVRLRFDRATTWGMIQEALPLAYMMVVSTVYTRMGIYIIERYEGMDAVADLGAASRLVEPIVFVAGIFVQSSLSYLSSLAAERRWAELHRFVMRVLGRSVLLLVPIAIVVSVWIAPLVHLWKPGWVEMAKCLRWLSLASVAMLVCQVCTSCLIALERRIWLAVIATVNLMVFLLIALWLVPVLRTQGAAIASLVMESLNAMIQVVLVHWLLRAHQRADVTGQDVID